MLAHISTPECAGLLVDLCASALGVEVQTDLVTDHIAPLFISCLPCNKFAVRVIARSQIMNELLGDGLAKHLIAAICAADYDLPETVMPVASNVVLQELASTRAALSRLRFAVLNANARNEHVSSEVVGESFILRARAVDMKSRRHCDADSRDVLKTATVDFALKSRLAFKNCPLTLARAELMMTLARTGHEQDDAQARLALKFVYSRTTIGRHHMV